MKTMKTMQTMKGGIGVLALVFAASLLLLLPGCQAPAGPQADRTGTVSLTIGHVGRAIQPDIGLGGFTGGFSAVFEREGQSVPVVFANGAHTAQVELPQGNWNLTVNAYIGDVVAATYGREVPVGPGFTGVTANLAPVPTGGPGTFSWSLTVPDGTTGILQVRTVQADGTIVTAPLPEGAEFNGTPYPTLWDGELELPAGTYFVRFALTHATHGVAFLNSDLHVYQAMTSRVERTFTNAQFRAPYSIASAAVAVTAPVTGATPNAAATPGEGSNFTAGTVTWYPVHSPFQAETQYTATVTLTANLGYVFATGTTATINGQTATVTGSGLTVTLSLAFASTLAGPTVITNAAVTVTAPVFGEEPDTEATVVGTDVGFTAGDVTWSPTHDPFRGGTRYTATVILTASAGHTFAGGLATATINGQAATVSNNTGEAATLAFEFQATALDPVMAAWQFGTYYGTAPDNNQAVSASIESGNASRPSGGQQQADARLQFLTQPGGVGAITPRVLAGASSGVHVVGTTGVHPPPSTPSPSELDDLAGNAWWQTYVSTVDRTDIAVTWRMRSTNTGPRDWRLQYRVGDDGGWNNVGGIIALPSGPHASTLGAPEQRRLLPATAEGHERLYLRWLMTSNLAPNGNPIQPGGTHQINDLVIFSGADSADFDNQDDRTGTFTINWAGFANPLLAQDVSITRNEAGAISINAPEGAFTSIQWLNDNMQPIGNAATLPSGDFPPLVTVRVRTAGNNRTYSIVLNTATGAVFN